MCQSHEGAVSRGHAVCVSHMDMQYMQYVSHVDMQRVSVTWRRSVTWTCSVCQSRGHAVCISHMEGQCHVDMQCVSVMWKLM